MTVNAIMLGKRERQPFIFGFNDALHRLMTYQLTTGRPVQVNGLLVAQGLLQSLWLGNLRQRGLRAHADMAMMNRAISGLVLTNIEQLVLDVFFRGTRSPTELADQLSLRGQSGGAQRRGGSSTNAFTIFGSFTWLISVMTGDARVLAATSWREVFLLHPVVATALATALAGLTVGGAAWTVVRIWPGSPTRQTQAGTGPPPPEREWWRHRVLSVVSAALVPGGSQLGGHVVRGTVTDDGSGVAGGTVQRQRSLRLEAQELRRPGRSTRRYHSSVFSFFGYSTKADTAVANMMPSKADFTETVNSAKNLLAYRAATSIFKMSKSVLETIWRRASVHAEEAVRSSIAFVQQAVNAQGLLVAGLALAALALLPGLASLASRLRRRQGR
jgi:hypothetical protein